MFNNPDFYPTPTTLINKMISKVEWRKVSTVLEPSGGKGDLLKAIHNQFSYTKAYRNTKNYDIETVEIDKNLQAILKDQGYRLVHDNFLTFNTYKNYDLIIANFPFSEGDKHLMKAIEMLERQGKTGQLVAIVNAESLRNPYSNLRKVLKDKLSFYGAEVDFLESQFITAERKTNVEIALINLKIEKVNNDSLLLDELKQAETHENIIEDESTALIDSDFIKGIVTQYEHEIKVGLKLISEYKKLKPYMLSSFDGSSSVLNLTVNNDNEDLENNYIQEIRMKYWKALFTNEQFIGLFTSNLKQKYMEKVQELKDYDFSLFNIYTLRLELSKEMITGVEDTILNLFEEFSYKHYYDEQSKNVYMFNGWKTNKAYKINKKVIIPLNAYNHWWNGAYDPLDYKVLDKLRDIEKVFNYLDDARTEDIDLREELELAKNYQDTKKIELKYFYITFYKKGTAHIEFKDMDLLKKFNLFGSQKKGWLPPHYGKARYEDMTQEEKEIVKEFEGVNSYNETLNNADFFFLNTENLLMIG